MTDRHPLSTPAILDRTFGYDAAENAALTVQHEFTVAVDEDYSHDVEAIAALAALHLTREQLQRHLNSAFDACADKSSARQRMREQLELLSAQVQHFQVNLDLYDQPV